MGDAPLRRGRPPLSPTTRAKRRKESKLKIHDTRITIGNTFVDWMAIKDEKGFTKHEEVARCLINTYRKYNEICSEPSLQTSQDGAGDLFFTPAEDDPVDSRAVLASECEDCIPGPAGLSPLAHHYVIPAFARARNSSEMCNGQSLQTSQVGAGDLLFTPAEDDPVDSRAVLASECEDCIPGPAGSSLLGKRLSPLAPHHIMPAFARARDEETCLKGSTEKEVIKIIIKEEGDDEVEEDFEEEEDKLQQKHVENGRSILNLPIFPSLIHSHPLCCALKSDHRAKLVPGQTRPSLKRSINIQRDVPR